MEAFCIFTDSSLAARSSSFASVICFSFSLSVSCNSRMRVYSCSALITEKSLISPFLVSSFSLIEEGRKSSERSERRNNPSFSTVIDSSTAIGFTSRISFRQPCRLPDEPARYNIRFPSRSPFSSSDEATPVFPRFRSPMTNEIFLFMDCLIACCCDEEKYDGKMASFVAGRAFSRNFRANRSSAIVFGVNSLQQSFRCSIFSAGFHRQSISGIFSPALHGKSR